MHMRNHFGRHLFRCLSTALTLALTLTLAAPLHAQIKWKHGITQAKGDAGIFWMALDKGFFKAQGLDVEYVQFRGDLDSMRALLAGAVDSASVSASPPLTAIEHGSDVRFIGSSMSGYPMALWVRKDVTSWDQLKGKAFGVSAPGAMPEVMARQMLIRKGIDPDSVKIVNAGADGSRIKALVAGKIDATIAGSEHAAVADKFGIKVMAYATDLVPEYPRNFLTVQEKTLKERPEVAIKFLAGYMQGLNYALTHRAETLALTGKINNMPANTPGFAVVYDEVVAKHYTSAKMEVPRDKLEWMQAQLLKDGTLKKKVDLNKYIDDSYRQAALKRVDFH